MCPPTRRGDMLSTPIFYPLCSSPVSYPIYSIHYTWGEGVGGGLATRISSGGGKGGTPPLPSPSAGLGSGPERLQTLRYGYPGLQSSSRAPPEASERLQERLQDASHPFLDRPNGENTVQNHPKLSSRSSESSFFTFLKICTFDQMEPANDAPGAPPRRHF